MSEHELPMALRRAYLAMHRRTDAVLANVGITADQFVLLAALSEGEALSQSELVVRTSSDPNTLRAMLVLLERRGLVRRRPHPTDRRARRVSLTPQGRQVYRKAWHRSEPLRKQMAQAVSAPGGVSLTAQLQQLAEGISPQEDLAREVRSRKRLETTLSMGRPEPARDV